MSTVVVHRVMYISCSQKECLCTPYRKSQKKRNAQRNKMTIRVDNLFANLPELYESEQSLSLFEKPSIKIERIVSQSHSSPPGFWYDQDEDEWVMVVRGEATLEVEGGRARADERGRSCDDCAPRETSSSANGSGDHLARRAYSLLEI